MTAVRAGAAVHDGGPSRDEAGRRVNEGFVPLMRKIPGFVAYSWVDAGNGVMFSTSVFQDQVGAEESVSRAAAGEVVASA